MLARELLDHGVVIGLGAGTALVFMVLERGGVRAVVARWVIPVVIGWLVRGLCIQDWGWGLGPGWIPAVAYVIVG
jgi:hypothetical protein